MKLQSYIKAIQQFKLNKLAQPRIPPRNTSSNPKVPRIKSSSVQQMRGKIDAAHSEINLASASHVTAVPEESLANSRYN